MTAILEVESTLTDRYQTTVPETVRRALSLGKRDKTHYTIRPGSDVVLTRAGRAEVDDPVLNQFLGLLTNDMTTHPERLRTEDTSFSQRIQSLRKGVIVDIDTELSAEDE
jgi:antitoxin PrlF